MTDISNWHYAYMDFVRHWHPQSEPYTGGDALFTLLEEGWDIEPEVRYDESWLAGVRSVLVYYFTLRRGDETLVMPVIRNPYVNRIVREMPARLVAMENQNRSERRVRPSRG
jgi:hypothetical protein